MDIDWTLTGCFPREATHAIQRRKKNSDKQEDRQQSG